MTEGLVSDAPVVDEYEDFFNPKQVVENVFLPDGKQYVTIQKFNEGERRQFQKANKSQVTGSRTSDELKFDMDSSEERKSLIKVAVIDWHIVTRDPSAPNGWRDVPFGNGNALAGWVDKAPIQIIDLIVEKIRLMNTWLLADMTSTQIQAEIDRLNKLLEKRVQMEEEDKSLPR